MYTAVVTTIKGNEQTTTETPIRNHTEWRQFSRLLKPHPSCIGVSHDAYDTIHTYQYRKTYILATLHPKP